MNIMLISSESLQFQEDSQYLANGSGVEDMRVGWLVSWSVGRSVREHLHACTRAHVCTYVRTLDSIYNM